jgi:hypothetical protein
MLHDVRRGGQEGASGSGSDRRSSPATTTVAP